MFVNNLKETLNEEFNTSTTTNGAIGYRTTGKELLDINYSVSSMRDMNEQEIVDKFIKVFYENKLLAVKWLFFARDVREGLGERRLFRTCIKYLAENHSEIAKATIKLVSEYGRWDDLLCLLDTNLCDDVIKLFKEQLDEDIKNMNDNKPISLISKWLPSVNTSSKETKRLAHIIISKLGFTEKQYRKMLSKLRSYLKIVETYMSKNEWDKIDYSTVPSRANLIYSDAFLRNDEERRKKYLDSLQKGETKINSSVLFPHDIVHKYFENSYREELKKTDDISLEEMWKALPNYINNQENTICVADGSGSMTDEVGGTNVTALEVANALAIYFSERSSGQFKDNYITFSENPQLVNFSEAKSLREKIEIALKYNEVADTNIEAVFDLILQTAINNNMSQNELPQNILILSDMEFNNCIVTNNNSNPSKKLFETFSERYKEHGYKLPRLVFWNICSKTNTIPVKENELGVALVSGFSPTIAKMVLSDNLDPLDCLLEQINSERYKPVENAIKDIIK